MAPDLSSHTKPKRNYDENIHHPHANPRFKIWLDRPDSDCKDKSDRGKVEYGKFCTVSSREDCALRIRFLMSGSLFGFSPRHWHEVSQ